MLGRARGGGGMPREPDGFVGDPGHPGVSAEKVQSFPVQYPGVLMEGETDNKALHILF